MLKIKNRDGDDSPSLFLLGKADEEPLFSSLAKHDRITVSKTKMHNDMY